MTLDVYRGPKTTQQKATLTTLLRCLSMTLCAVGAKYILPDIGLAQMPLFKPHTRMAVVACVKL